MSCRRDYKQDQQGLYYMAFLSCTQSMLKNTAAFLLRYLQATTSTIQQAADCCPGGRVLVILQVMQPAFTNPAAASREWVQTIPCLGAQRRGQCLLAALHRTMVSLSATPSRSMPAVATHPQEW